MRNTDAWLTRALERTRAPSLQLCTAALHCSRVPRYTHLHCSSALQRCTAALHCSRVPRYSSSRGAPSARRETSASWPLTGLLPDAGLASHAAAIEGRGGDLEERLGGPEGAAAAAAARREVWSTLFAVRWHAGTLVANYAARAAAARVAELGRDQAERRRGAGESR